MCPKKNLFFTELALGRFSPKVAIFVCVFVPSTGTRNTLPRDFWLKSESLN